jgi:hypothetical protein
MVTIDGPDRTGRDRNPFRTPVNTQQSNGRALDGRF